MTVAELIRQLQRCKPTAQVLTWASENGQPIDGPADAEVLGVLEWSNESLADADEIFIGIEFEEQTLGLDDIMPTGQG